MTRTLSALFALFVLSLPIPAAHADVTIGGSPTDYLHQRVSITPAALREAMAAPNTKVTEVSEASAVRAASLRGVTLPVSATASTSSTGYSHPWVIVKAGIGLPGMIDADIEIYVHDNWTVEVGAGTGLLPTVYMAGVRWRPDALCWGCQGSNAFSIGLGLDALTVGTGVEQDFLIAGIADAQYLHRFAEHFGWVIGLKMGAGATTGITRYPSNNSVPTDTSSSTAPSPPAPGASNPPMNVSYHWNRRVEPGLTF